MLTLRLLGPPGGERDGVVLRPPRGRKAWALLGYLLLAERPPGRRHLAELLFADADDPLGALRWTLAELRRTFGLADAFRGDPVDATLPALVRLDLRDDVPLGAGELLEGLSLPSCPEFESWLVVARHRVSAGVEAQLRETAIALLAAGRAADAVRPAAAVVARNPLDEGNHELLIRCLAVTGDRAAALKQVAVCEDLLHRQLGIEPSPALRDAAGAAPGMPMLAAAGGAAAALSQIEAGRAAIVAGAADAGVQCLRRAVADADRCGDDALHARALVALGGSLVHAVRGRDEEGSVLLHEGLSLAVAAGDRATAVTACRELGFVEVQAGRRNTADTWLSRAQEAAQTDAEWGAILGVRGMNASDSGDYPAAFAHLNGSIEHARAANDVRQEAWSLSILGRAHLLRREDSQAHGVIRESIEVVTKDRWMAFLPWPQALSAELQLLCGNLDAAGQTLEQAWVLALQTADPCWEGMVARGLGVLHTARGETTTGKGWLIEAGRRCARTPDRYQWVRAFVLDAAISSAQACGDTATTMSAVQALAGLAARCDMREMVVRAELHRSRLGYPDALRAARALSEGIDNPALATLIAAAGVVG